VKVDGIEGASVLLTVECLVVDWRRRGRCVDLLLKGKAK